MSAVFRFRSVPVDWLRPRAPTAAPAAVPALRVSVVVVTNRRLPQLMRCLQALLAQNVRPHSFEILVVDQARDKATRHAVQALAATLPKHLLHYLRPPGDDPGPAAARNRGWRAALAPLVAFTDDHAVPDRAWLLEGDQAMCRTRCVALSGRVVVPRAANDLQRLPTDHELAVRQLEHAEFASANAFVWRKALQAVGGFDARFQDPAHEDADLQFRLLREGPVGRSESAVVVHPVGRERWGDSLRAQRDKFFDALLYREHPRQYRRRAEAAPPWGNYAVVLLALAALASLAAGSGDAALFFVISSAAGIGMLALRRLSRTAKTPAHLFEVLATSALIPFLAAYWRLRGAWHFRVWFL